MVAQVHDDELLVAEPSEMLQGGRRFIRVAFRALPETWRVRDRENAGTVSRGELLVYLNPTQTEPQVEGVSGKSPRHRRAPGGPVV